MKKQNNFLQGLAIVFAILGMLLLILSGLYYSPIIPAFGIGTGLPFEHERIHEICSGVNVYCYSMFYFI